MSGGGDGFDDAAYARITGRTVDDEIQAIDREAEFYIAVMKFDLVPKKRNELARWLVKHLGMCNSYCRPPPPKLVELAAHLLKVDTPPRSRRRNKEKFRAAAAYVAEHPNATPSAIARARSSMSRKLKSRRGSNVLISNGVSNKCGGVVKNLLLPP